jgi:hypothetical protein
MGMYISFATKDNNDSVFFTARLSDNIYSQISERVGPVDINDMDKFVKLTTKQLGDVSFDLDNQISLIKERIALTLMKRDYDVVDLQSDIEYYEDLLRDLGRVLLLIDMAWENNEVLYVNIG